LTALKGHANQFYPRASRALPGLLRLMVPAQPSMAIWVLGGLVMAVSPLVWTAAKPRFFDFEVVDIFT
jgi:hypothetical protein